ncbi:MAG: hypothetical protein OSB09_08000, partial [Planctomycetota bacterium]|nr:hypothetical protein [Planctomycetota bacterium]
SDSWNAVRGPTRVQHRWLRFSFLVWAAFLLMPAASSGQIPGEPDDTVVDSPPQMICMGNSLKAMRDDYLVPHLLARHGVTRLRFSRVVSANGSDIYLGAIRIEGDPAPLGLGNGPLLPSTSIARWGYLHQDNSAPPDLAEDTFVMQQYPANSSRRSVPIIGSVQELDLLIQVCDWMEEGATPTQLLPMRQWLDQPDTRIQQLHSWRQGNRVHLLLTGREEPLNGISTRWRTEISWQPTTLGGFLDLEVQP